MVGFGRLKKFFHAVQSDKTLWYHMYHFSIAYKHWICTWQADNIVTGTTNECTSLTFHHRLHFDFESSSWAGPPRSCRTWGLLCIYDPGYRLDINIVHDGDLRLVQRDILATKFKILRNSLAELKRWGNSTGRWSMFTGLPFASNDVRVFMSKSIVIALWPLVGELISTIWNFGFDWHW